MDYVFGSLISKKDDPVVYNGGGSLEPFDMEIDDQEYV